MKHLWRIEYIFGKRNAGKSSIINAMTGQSLAIVSDVAGTTTDPVLKAMELLPLGPVVIIDTPGLDDVGELGLMRVQKAYQILNKTDIAVVVIDGAVGITEEDVDKLREAAKDFEEVSKSDDVTALAEADVKFHDIIYFATENQRLIQLLYNLREQMYRYRVEYLKREGVHATLFAEHDHIIECIARRDKVAAKQAIGTHIDNQMTSVADTIRTKK